MQNLVVNNFWLEMHKAYGFLRQIEIYTDRKRRQNRAVNIVLLCSVVFCSIASLYSQYVLGHWITVFLSILVALGMFIKEFIPQISQPEGELYELDKIHDFYKDYLQNLEYYYVQRLNNNPQINDKKMNDVFNEIKKTEGDRITTLNRLCRDMSKKEIEDINSETRKHFKIKYNKDKNETESK